MTILPTKPKNILFVDFNGVISYKLFWNSIMDETHKLNGEFQKIQDFLFKENFPIVSDWMLGNYTSEEIHRIIEKEIGVPYDQLFPIFEKDCRNLDISQPILNKVNQLREFYTTVLFTDNMDSFDRFTLDSNPQLYDAFDRIDNSATIKRFKKTDGGKHFLDVIKEYGAQVSNSILLDDSIKNCNIFKDLGGQYYNVTGEEGVLEALGEITPLTNSYKSVHTLGI